MSVISCQQNKDLRKLIEEYAEVLKREAHTLGSHGLDQHDFYNSGVFRGAIERVRGQFSATMKAKRDFVRTILDHLRERNFIEGWQSAGEANRHDYVIQLKSGRTCAIEQMATIPTSSNVQQMPMNS